MKLFYIMLLLFSFMAAGSDSLREMWDQSNDPRILTSRFTTKLRSLPRRGSLKVQPWAGSYWPTYRGGIALRWGQGRVTPFQYRVYSRRQLSKMSTEQIARLSPAEKYDIYMGRYDFPTVKAEKNRTSPKAQKWEGLCHGWAPASVLFSEPRPMTVRNKDGITIPFGSSDVKALLTYYQAEIGKATSKLLGQRCNVDLKKNPAAGSTPACRDTNAGSFHIMLANQVGLKKKSIILDITRDSQVWNHPVFAYQSKILREENGASRGAARGTRSEVVVETQVYYTIEIDANWNNVTGTNQYASDSKTYQYRLELDSSRRIIGGSWLSNDRPDFIWRQGRPRFQGYYSEIYRLYKQSK